MNMGEPIEALVRTGAIKLHGEDGFDGMRRAGRLAADCLDLLVPEVKPGVTTERLDDLAREFLLDHGALPACLFYKGYTKTVCISANHVVCHGIPGPKALREGDIINIDVTCILDGWHGDHSRMYGVGAVPFRARRLVDVTYEGLARGLAVIKPGARLGDIGHAIQAFAESNNFSVVREYCGHGIGRVYHEDPQVLHYGKPDTGMELVTGMTFTIEPMINAGRRDVRLLPDGWTVVTKDQSLSAQWEHTVLVTDSGFEVLTLGAGAKMPAASAAAGLDAVVTARG